MSKEKILIVDDEPHILELVRFNLEAGGFKVIEAPDGQKAIELAQTENPDLILLDLMLPGTDGLEVCRILRQQKATREIPIIMLTAKSEEIDKVLGLEIGADDYITKPFSPRELTARVKAVLRRSAGSEKTENNIKIGNLVIDIEKHEVLVDGEKQEFTPKEFDLLKLLASNPGKVFSREYLLENIWGYDYLGDTRTVDVHIRHLRQKVEKDSDRPVYIETVRGIGYKFNKPE
ncbi:MAG: two-component system, OmpR family, alkaline phosphatase synthesis response regulator PhoP [Thermoanaerobacteraceae bacterium]|jgi:two-component system alkaline phosphatase synthesis response regulator PhoP|uniref:Stage 0 sporulation protein A homolog n=1 Tax=Biomaibacter acetigenes TaxID=2316383 RepID=A0A3G2R5I5_9FIRM|nr:response regulator transcription factor [Biomaibacter acetigenes]MDK2877624.1 two-component system, OmpR family, alkaline phosphatase synthesis response regulator PhoP [Thermoanaerobacteraceae bacterium]RKL63125.1 DNA-binding response regulator [Thermoanaerobacteraceae bacterium SP2]AYO30368.1 response regulator [Biomaibacter acetigenes]MDN5300534.1 two-component system, OmpR family, alkaline phosphatase synthesis response regulator PhoP [Thermoanaerobacteraceae bacterium]MDN5311711.1 two-c